MSNRIFTAKDTGEEFEFDSTINYMAGTKIVIKPLPKPESKKVIHRLNFDQFNTHGYERCLISEEYKFTPEQGERVAERLRSVMRELEDEFEAVQRGAQS